MLQHILFDGSCRHLRVEHTDRHCYNNEDKLYWYFMGGARLADVIVFFTPVIL